MFKKCNGSQEALARLVPVAELGMERAANFYMGMSLEVGNLHRLGTCF